MSREQPSKSKRVQEYFLANPQARNRDVVKALSQFGITPADVSNAKAQLKKNYSFRRTRAVVAASATEGDSVADEDMNSSIAIAEIEATIDYVHAVGGISRARQLLAVIQLIREM